MVISDDATDQAEYALANCRPFGNSDYIWQRLCRHYVRRLEMLKGHSKYAQTLLSELSRTSEEQHPMVLGDPTVRMAIDGFLRYVMFGAESFPVDELELVLDLAAANLRSRKAVPPLAEGAVEAFTLQARSWPWVWCEDRVESDPLGDFFTRTFKYHVPGLSLMTPDLRMREMLLLGRTLLDDLLPELAQSALAHVHVIAVVDPGSSRGFTSLTHPRIPGTVVFSPLVLTSPWRAAEYLLHEAMHVKFTDLEHTHSLLHESYSQSSSPMIRPLWNRVQPGGASDWPISRSLTVCHVYTCLALFFSILAAKSDGLDGDRYGPLPANVNRKARRSFDRAHYMRQQLATHEDSLGPGGRLLVRWLDAVLCSFDPSPPSHGAYVHLLLDLYEREADRLAQLLQDRDDGAPPVDPRWTRLILALARQEIERFGAVAPLLNGSLSLSDTLRRLDRLAVTVGSSGEFREGAEFFISVRRSLLAEFRVEDLAELRVEDQVSGSPDLRDSQAEAALLIRNIVEESSQDLSALFSVSP
jgi:hypothetical protein